MPKENFRNVPSISPHEWISAGNILFHKDWVRLGTQQTLDFKYFSFFCYNSKLFQSSKYSNPLGKYMFVEYSHDIFLEYSEKAPYEIPGNIPKIMFREHWI